MGTGCPCGPGVSGRFQYNAESYSAVGVGEDWMRSRATLLKLIETKVTSGEATQTHAHLGREESKFMGRAYRLEFSAGVGIDFAIQANFFESWSCPLH